MKEVFSGIVFNVYYYLLYFEKWGTYQLNWRDLHPNSHECWYMHNLGSMESEPTQYEIINAINKWRGFDQVEMMADAIKAYAYEHFVNVPNDTRTEKEKLTDRLKSMEPVMSN